MREGEEEERGEGRYPRGKTGRTLKSNYRLARRTKDDREISGNGSENRIHESEFSMGLPLASSVWIMKASRTLHKNTVNSTAEGEKGN